MLRRLATGLTMGTMLMACGGGGGGTPPDDGIPCPSGDCGDESFRRAIPSRDNVTIAFGSAVQGKRAPGERTFALEAISPAYDVTDAYVADLNADVEELFASLEELAQVTPEIDEDAIQRWRDADPEDATLDEVLTVTSDDGVEYAIHYTIGPTGFDPDGVAPVIHGGVRVEGDEKQDFELTIDLDALTAMVPEANATGDIEITMQPWGGGTRELWYDLVAVSVGGEPLETSITTYWIFDDGSGGLEYLADFDGVEATVYARWDQDGGRYDHHAFYEDPELGPVDEILTDCWEGGGAQTFEAWAVIDSIGDWYGEIDGSEADCLFGPVDGHPDPGDAFDDLPGEGEWDDALAE